MMNEKRVTVRVPQVTKNGYIIELEYEYYIYEGWYDDDWKY